MPLKFFIVKKFKLYVKYNLFQNKYLRWDFLKKYWESSVDK